MRVLRTAVPARACPWEARTDRVRVSGASTSMAFGAFGSTSTVASTGGHGAGRPARRRSRARGRSNRAGGSAVAAAEIGIAVTEAADMQEEQSGRLLREGWPFAHGGVVVSA